MELVQIQDYTADGGVTGNLIRKPRKDICMYKYIPREVRSKRIDGKPNPKTEKGYTYVYT